MVPVTVCKIEMAAMLGMVLLAAAASSAPAMMAAPAEVDLAQVCTNAAQFVADVTIPDNTILRPGQAFTKTWQLRNTGSCVWNTSYKLMRDSGEALGSLASVTLPRSVARNNTVDISVQLVAPPAQGVYGGFWQLTDSSGWSFGPKLRVVVVVPDQTVGEKLPEPLTYLPGGYTGEPIRTELWGLLPECNRLDCRSIQSFAAGEEIAFVRGSRRPNAQIPMAIYRHRGGQYFFTYELIHAVMATTEANGSLRVLYRIPLSLEPGRYVAVFSALDMTEFYIRAAPDSPLPFIEVGGQDGNSGVWTFRAIAWNQSASASRGGSLTLSSPDVERLEISEADVPIVPLSSSNCNVTTPNARELTPSTPCHRALQHNTACKKTVDLSYPMAEAWYQSWATGDCHRLTVRIWPRAGMREVRIYARVAMLAGSSGCRIEIAPTADEADATDQQGFPVQVVTVPVSR